MYFNGLLCIWFLCCCVFDFFICGFGMFLLVLNFYLFVGIYCVFYLEIVVDIWLCCNYLFYYNFFGMDNDFMFRKCLILYWIFSVVE